jgi:hypothetical protein
MPWFILGVAVTGVLAMGLYLVRIYPADPLIRMVVIWFIGMIIGFAFGRMTTKKTLQ